MARLVDWSKINLTGYSQKTGHEFPVSIEATVASGFECAVQAEVLDSLGIKAHQHEGRVFFDIPLSDVEKVLKLRCVDNVNVLFGVWPKIEMDLKSTPVEDCLSQLNKALMTDLNWLNGLKAWNKVFNFFDSDLPIIGVLQRIENYNDTKSEEPLSKLSVSGDDSKQEEDRVPRFRVSCYRSGENYHSFGSMDVAKSFGGHLHDRFRWTPKMKDFDIEIIVNIDKDQIYCGIGLTHESLFRRNIVSFGPTTLRPTICASMLKLAEIRPGDVVVDPMCGSGSIPLEAGLTNKSSFYVAGDFNGKAVQSALQNFSHQNEKRPLALPTDLLRWDVTRIPLRDNSVDVFVTDLPFGKRSGSRTDNRVLYPKILTSMARVVKPITGRAVLLTHDKTSMFKCTGKFNQYWRTTRMLSCNIGGLTALVFLMKRTGDSPTETPE